MPLNKSEENLLTKNYVSMPLSKSKGNLLQNDVSMPLTKSEENL
jgi:hypothetical protein